MENLKNSWKDDALCQREENFNEFFDDYEQDPDIAKKTDKLCFSCPVRLQCLEYAVDPNKEESYLFTGVFGGAYFNMGKFSKNKNKHKTKAMNEQLLKEINLIKNGEKVE